MFGRVRKYICYAVLGGFIACISLIIMARLLVTPEKMRNTLVPIVENYLHCKINLGKIEVNLLSGVALTNLELLSSNGKSMFLAADKVVMRYQLLPLFTQRIVVDEIRLEHPRANVVILSDGKLNLLQLVDGGGNPSDKGSDTLAHRDNKDQNINLVVSKVFVTQGEILLRDYRFSAVPHRYRLHDLGVQVSGFSLVDAFDIKLWGKINGAPVDIDGLLNVGDGSYDVNLNVADLDMVQFQPYYRHLAGKLNSLKLNIDGRFWGDATRHNVKGRLDLRQLDAMFVPYQLHADYLAIDCDITLDNSTDLITVSSLDLNVDGVNLHGAGVVKNIRTAPYFDVNVVADKWQMRSVVSVLPEQLARTVEGYDLAGDLTLKMDLLGSGDIKNLLANATIALDGIQASVGKLRPSLSGEITLNGKELRSKQLKLVVGDNAMALDLHSKNWSANRPKIYLNIKADSFTTMGIGYDHKLSEPRVGGSSGGYPADLVVVEPGPFNLPVDLIGDISIADLTLDSYKLTNVRAHYTVNDSVVVYDYFNARLADGVLNSSGRVDLNRQGLVTFTTKSFCCW
ncbi:MAG: hypothetical protein B6I36_02910 [Desulfobacteraceae bacterium 4572_35.1]|nr:MAG: hypothetical protein B6I36_02910 [Desulfobacteraceae bacterium 4572_35.1]